MDFHSAFEIERMQFFSRRKSAIIRLDRLGLECPYISAKLTYEQLFLEEVERDFNSIEKEYLKEGILCIFECLKVVENEKELTEELAEEQVIFENKEKIQEYKKLDGFSEEQEKDWISIQVKSKITLDKVSRKATIDALKKEVAEFKIRLGRMDIAVLIEKGNIQFSNTQENINKMQVVEPFVENPYPEIFLDDDAYNLFKTLHSIFKNTKNQGADYGFIYWKMLKDGYILETYKPEKFRKWIGEETHNITTSNPFKTLNWCSTQHKEDLYETLKTIR